VPRRAGPELSLSTRRRVSSAVTVEWVLPRGAATSGDRRASCRRCFRPCSQTSSRDPQSPSVTRSRAPSIVAAPMVT
jgi:hypothetical protein